MLLKFYPLDFDYKSRDGKVLVYLYGRDEKGQKVCVIHSHQPYFYTDISILSLEGDFEAKLKSLQLEMGTERARVMAVEKIEKELWGRKKQFWKVYVNFPKAVPLLSREIESWGITCYEKDILFIHRYLRDNNITPGTLIQASGDYIKSSELKVPIFISEKVETVASDNVLSWKILAVDIETYALRKEIDAQRNEIVMLGFYGKDEKGQEFKKVITWKIFEQHLDYVEIVKSEKELLERFVAVIGEFGPDILTGYHSDGFDLPYIKARADKLGVKLNVGVDHSELLASVSGNWREGEGKIKGIVHVDVLKFIRNIFGRDLETDSYTLDAVGEELIGQGKKEVNLDELAPAWDQASKKLEKFCEYNLQDARLTFLLADKLLPEMLEFTKIVGLPLFDVIRMRFSRLVESYILKKAVEHNVLAPNKPGDTEIDSRMEETYEGGFVYEPRPGLYDDLVVFDFRSLYPTIITAHNISPESFQKEGCVNKQFVPGQENYWFCVDQPSFLPTILGEIILKRAELKKKLKTAKKSADKNILKARSYALKTLANSFYGYLGFFGARWYSVESARSTTAYARDYIQKAIKKAQERGFEVCYSDTDSCFLLLGDKDRDDALKFMDEVNKDLPGEMELEFQGYYPKGIFVPQKSSDKGAKKKYALLCEDDNLKITGFEMVRRNWSQISKEVQEEVLKLILHDRVEEAVSYVQKIVKELKKGAIPISKLVIKTQITRELEKYSSEGPHVAVARRMEEDGQKVYPGMVVEYVIAKGSGLIRERAKMVSEVAEGGYDADYYLNNQIIPAVASIFSVLGYSEDKIFAETSQTGLGKFF